MATKTFEQYKEMIQLLSTEFSSGRIPISAIHAGLAQFVTGNRYLHKGHIKNMQDMHLIKLSDAPGVFEIC